MLSQGEVVVIDVRSDEEAARGIIPGSRHIPLHLIPLVYKELIGNLPIVFYCHSGIRSAQACAFLSSKVAGKYFNLQGGILAWGNAGQSLVPRN